MAKKKLKGLEDLYLEQLRDLYSAETQIIDALPRMVDRTSNRELKQALEEHLQVTEGQKRRLEEIFEALDRKPTGHECKGMKGLIDEGAELLEKDGDPAVIDAGIIAAAQRVEHYEIAGYGTAYTFADRLGHDEAAGLLEESLEEEEEADETLSEIAERNMNREAQKATA